MAKSNKFVSKVPKLEELKGPWGGDEDAEVDKAEVLKIIHNLQLDKAKAQDARDDALAETEEVKAENVQLQETIDKKVDPDTALQLDKLKQERDKAKQGEAEANLRADRVEVAAEKGLTPSQAKRLVGKNKEELEADADEFLKDLAPAKSEEEEEREAAGRTIPQGLRLNNGGGDDASKITAEPDYEKIAAQIGGTRAL